MGNISSLDFSGKGNNFRILMLGLDGEGKTTILYQLKLGKMVTTIPTVGWNVNIETIDYKNRSLTIYDMFSQHRTRSHWTYYYEGCSAIIFVVDSRYESRVSEAREELARILEDIESEEGARADVPLLVYANKQDLRHTMTVAEVRDALGLNSIRGREWHIQGTVAITGEGLYDGLDWLLKRLK
ncbi:Arf GTPase arf1 [Haplosporangium sp. Z 27]|nr:Arf GTPase arf1 [Haplosporangium sp. Z 27]